VLANDQQLHPPAQPWDFGGYLDSYDAASVRRGHQVYTQVCASCHGLARIAYRNLTNVCYSEAEARLSPRSPQPAPALEQRSTSTSRRAAPHHAARAPQVKAMAEDTDVMDGPNDEGEMFERPGKASDYFPSPYPNEEAPPAPLDPALPQLAARWLRGVLLARRCRLRAARWLLVPRLPPRRSSLFAGGALREQRRVPA